MAGANYMGGKRLGSIPLSKFQPFFKNLIYRNTVKSRLRDIAGRTQKGFFGRRRLEMLSKGLARNSELGNRSLSRNENRQSISLSHAKVKVKDVGLPNDKAESNTYIASPACVEAVPESCRSLERASSPSYRGTTLPEWSICLINPLYAHIRTLANVATGPTSLRSLYDRILAMPDLAGLQHRKLRSPPHENLASVKFLVAAPDYVDSEIHANYVRQSSVDDGFSDALSQADFSNSGYYIGSSIRSSLSSHDSVDECAMKNTSLVENELGLASDESNSPFRYTSTRGRETKAESPGPCLVSWSNTDTPRPSSDTRVSTGTTSWDGQKEPAPDVAYLESPFQFTPWVSKHNMEASTPKRQSKDKDSNHKHYSLVDTSPFTWFETPEKSLPDVPTFSERDSFDRLSPGYDDLPRQLPGCIFDYEDPWNAIGVILGLPTTESKAITLEEELETLGATGSYFFSGTSGDVYYDDTLVEDYSDERTSTTLLSSDDNSKYALSSDTSQHFGKEFNYAHPPPDDSIMAEDSVQAIFDEKSVEMKTDLHNVLSSQENLITQRMNPDFVSEENSKGRRDCERSPVQNIESTCDLDLPSVDGVYYGPCLFRNDSDTESV
ncbi:hypothetical protein AX17_002776 [Amanita inopinata Kibby_2008]|nr:hypothetical protein AX17_002776 [Amanita inopinata Kibby_2008]